MNTREVILTETCESEESKKPIGHYNSLQQPVKAMLKKDIDQRSNTLVYKTQHTSLYTDDISLVGSLAILADSINI